MKSSTPVAVFMAASALIAGCSGQADIKSGQEQSNAGGTKEWTTDQAVEAESKLDKDAKKAAEKAKKENVCIPIGEGENCW